MRIVNAREQVHLLPFRESPLLRRKNERGRRRRAKTTFYCIMSLRGLAAAVMDDERVASASAERRIRPGTGGDDWKSHFMSFFVGHRGGHRSATPSISQGITVLNDTARQAIKPIPQRDARSGGGEFSALADLTLNIAESARILVTGHGGIPSDDRPAESPIRTRERGHKNRTLSLPRFWPRIGK